MRIDSCFYNSWLQFSTQRTKNSCSFTLALTEPEKYSEHIESVSSIPRGSVATSHTPVSGQNRSQVYAGFLYVVNRDRFSSGKPTIRPVLKRNVAAVTGPFVLQRVGGRRAAGYTFCPEATNELDSKRKESVCAWTNEKKREREGTGRDGAAK